MSNLRPLAYRVVIKKLRKLGFGFRRATGGTHEIWWNETTRKTCVVPHHKKIKTGTLKSILRQADVYTFFMGSSFRCQDDEKTH